MGWKKLFALATETSNSEGDLFEGLANKFDEEEWKWQQ